LHNRAIITQHDRIDRKRDDFNRSPAREGAERIDLISLSALKLKRAIFKLLQRARGGISDLKAAIETLSALPWKVTRECIIRRALATLLPPGVKIAAVAALSVRECQCVCALPFLQIFPG
jgi:hypothetical protein